MVSANQTSVGAFLGTGGRGLRGRAGVFVAVGVVVVLLVLVLLVLSQRKLAGPGEPRLSGELATPVELKTEYRNPFARETQYVNPFEEQKSPFGSLQQ